MIIGCIQNMTNSQLILEKCGEEWRKQKILHKFINSHTSGNLWYNKILKIRIKALKIVFDERLSH